MSTFIHVGGAIGGLATLLGIFVTAIIGLALLKNQGGAVLTKIRTDLAQGRVPVGSIADSISLAFGGVLMLIPGYVTDCVGVLLFIPGLRTIAGAWILHQLVTNNRFTEFLHVGGRGEFYAQEGFAAHDTRTFHDADDIIEGDVTEYQPERDRLDNR